MIAAPVLSVTLSSDLMRHMRAESRRLGVPLEWLVASMVVDTMEDDATEETPLAASA